MKLSARRRNWKAWLRQCLICAAFAAVGPRVGAAQAADEAARAADEAAQTADEAAQTADEGVAATPGLDAPPPPRAAAADAAEPAETAGPGETAGSGEAAGPGEAAETTETRPPPTPAAIELGRARAAINAGRPDVAIPILDGLKGRAAAAGVDETEIAFLRAYAAMVAGDLDDAIDRFRKILLTKPDLVRVRLELARAFFLNEDDDNAEFHFNRAISGGVPLEVEQNIRRFLDAIRARRDWSFSATIALLPDSNINAAPDDRTISIDAFGTPLDFTLDDDARQKSGIGLFSSFQAGYRFRLSERWRLETDGSVVSRLYRESDFNDIYGSLEAGPTWLFPDGEVGVAGVLRRRWYGGDGYNWGYGAAVKGGYRFTPNLYAHARLEALDTPYDDSALQDGQTYALTSTWIYGLDAASRASLNFGLYRRAARDDSFQSWTPAGGLDWSRDFGWGITFGLGGQASWEIYDGQDLIFGEDRRDFQLSLSANLAKRDWIVWNAIPVLYFRQSWNRSSIDFYDYERTQLYIGFTQVF